jgi:RNA polymerase sigma-70 factor (sigma-E family)
LPAAEWYSLADRSPLAEETPLTAPPGFEEFVTLRSSRLLRAAYQLTHDWAQAEDLLQTAYAKAWRVWSRLSAEADPEPYLRKIMFNTYVTWWRRRWHGEEPTDSLPDQRHPDEYNRSHDRDQLWRALGRLPRRQRAIVVLRFFEDMTEAQVADVLDCSVGTVKSQISRALAKLRLDPSLLEEVAR